MGGWATWITGTTPRGSLMFKFGNGFFANMLFDDPAWDFKTFSLDHDLKLADDKMAQRLNNEGLFAFEACHHFRPCMPEINASTADLDFLRGTVRQITDLGWHLRREAKQIGCPGSLGHDCPMLPSRNCAGCLINVGT